MCDADKRTLCPRCYRDYVSAGYAIRRDYDVTVKDDCDICGRPGWEYWVIKGEHHAR
jgi:hypothetical protein